MRLIILISLILAISACSSSNKKKLITKSITFSKQDIDKIKNELGNNSVSGTDILWARMQSVPIPALKQSKKDVIQMLNNSKISIISNTKKLILVLGSSRPVKSHRNEISVSNPDHFEYKFEDDLLVSGPNRKSPFDLFLVAGEGASHEVSPELALKAVKIFRNDPLGVDSSALSIIVDFARESKNVLVKYSPDKFPWILGSIDEELQFKLICAYVAGNIEYQLTNEINENRTIEGIEFLIYVYEKLRKSGNHAELKNIDEWIEKKLASKM